MLTLYRRRRRSVRAYSGPSDRQAGARVFLDRCQELLSSGGSGLVKAIFFPLRG